jgi:hypothetical protein
VFTSTVQLVIVRPLDEVFAFVSDVRNRPRWDDSVDSEGLTSPEPIRFDPRDGWTRVEASVIGRPAGLMRLLQPLLARTTQQNLDRGYANLKRRLETGSGP